MDLFGMRRKVSMVEGSIKLDEWHIILYKDHFCGTFVNHKNRGFEIFNVSHIKCKSMHDRSLIFHPPPLSGVESLSGRDITPPIER